MGLNRFIKNNHSALGQIRFQRSASTAAYFLFQVEKSSSELSTIEQEMATLDDAHKKTAADVESTILSLETTSEQVWCSCRDSSQVVVVFLQLWTSPLTAFVKTTAQHQKGSISILFTNSAFEPGAARWESRSVLRSPHNGCGSVCSVVLRSLWFQTQLTSHYLE